MIRVSPVVWVLAALVGCGGDSAPSDIATADLGVLVPDVASPSDALADDLGSQPEDGVAADAPDIERDVDAPDVAVVADAVADTLGSPDAEVIDGGGEPPGDVGADVVDLGPCEGIAFVGCCTADGVAKWCNNLTEELEVVDCVGEGAPGCGWLSDSAGYYCTSNKVGQPDPSGAAAYLCPGEACVDACVGRECGHDCGQSCGPGCADGQVCSAEGRCTNT